MTTKRGKRRKVGTPWGGAQVLEEVKVAQRAPEKQFSVVVELLESEGGESLVRIAYTTDGAIRRGPVTMRIRELERLRSALEARPGLSALLGLEVGEA